MKCGIGNNIYTILQYYLSLHLLKVFQYFYFYFVPLDKPRISKRVLISIIVVHFIIPTAIIITGNMIRVLIFLKLSFISIFYATLYDTYL